jgi:hypothetical protein
VQGEREGRKKGREKEREKGRPYNFYEYKRNYIYTCILLPRDAEKVENASVQ